MDAYSMLLTRRACRAYKPDPVPEELLEKVLVAGSFAPSAMGRQPCKILAVTDKALRDELMKDNAAILGNPDSDPFYGAPVVLVVLADASLPTRVYDGSLVMGNLLNAAHAVGLAGCWIHRARETFEMPRWKAFLTEHGIEGNWEGIGNCILGFPAQPLPAPSPRKADMICRF